MVLVAQKRLYVVLNDGMQQSIKLIMQIRKCSAFLNYNSYLYNNPLLLINTTQYIGNS